MGRHQTQRLFFIELCIAFLFFLMIAVTCFLSLTRSKLIQMDASRQIQYVNITDNIAETFLSASDRQQACEKLQTEFKQMQITDHLATMETAGLTVTVDLLEHKKQMQAIITVYDDDHPVYQLSVSKALGERL